MLFGSVTSIPSNAVYEDFTSMRNNGEGNPIWQPYTGGSGAGPNQTGSIVNGAYRLVVPVNNRPYIHFLPLPYVDPYGFVRNFIRTGAIDTTTNRMSFWLRPNTTGNITRRSDGGPIAEIGTYFKGNDGDQNQQGDHRYHYIDCNFIAGKWHYFVLNTQVQHKVGDSPYTNWPLIDAYFNQMTRHYFTDEYGAASVWGNSTWDFDDYQLWTASGEPDQYVSNVVAVYTGSRYELSWNARKETSTVYNITYNGTGGGSVASTNTVYTGVFWASPNMSEVATMVFTIEAVGQGTTTITKVQR